MDRLPIAPVELATLPGPVLLAAYCGADRAERERAYDAALADELA